MDNDHGRGVAVAADRVGASCDLDTDNLAVPSCCHMRPGGWVEVAYRAACATVTFPPCQGGTEDNRLSAVAVADGAVASSSSRACISASVASCATWRSTLVERVVVHLGAEAVFHAAYVVENFRAAPDVVSSPVYLR